MSSGVTLRGLRAFLAAAEARSFKGAAGALCITETGVSKRIAALEEAVGVKLFERTKGHGRGLGRENSTMTEAGLALLIDAETAIRTLDAAVASIKAGAKS